MIAALYVQTGGCYFGLRGVVPYDISNDARLYVGPWPVVAHPPCPRWGRMAALVESLGGKRRGDDGDCFAAALEAVRRWGGVLEHPAVSAAWRAFGLPPPPSSGGWARGLCGGWSCHVEQGHYGHRAPKPTWLYAFGAELPQLKWGPSGATMRVGLPKSRKGERGVEISKRERITTPLPFRDMLLSIARSVHSVTMPSLREVS